jgi:hypothetical protein
MDNGLTEFWNDIKLILIGIKCALFGHEVVEMRALIRSVYGNRDQAYHFCRRCGKRIN